MGWKTNNHFWQRKIEWSLCHGNTFGGSELSFPFLNVSICVLALLDEHHLEKEASTSTREMLEMKILTFHPRSTESEILGGGAQQFVLEQAPPPPPCPRWFWCMLNFQNHWSRNAEFLNKWIKEVEADFIGWIYTFGEYKKRYKKPQSCNLDNSG